MNEILGIILPLLMSGAGPAEILKALGANGSASSMDGLEGMLLAQKERARYYSPLNPSQKTISSATESLIDMMGINPYSGEGQGMASFISHMYHLAPDMVGNIIGVPNGGQFFSTIVNGSSGISAASGRGTTDIFNPYSMLSAHTNARDLARQVYNMGIKRIGGYDVAFGHGLNIGEMGKVAQRLLSSDIAYMDDDGNRLDISKNARGEYNNEQDAKKFGDNLRTLGSRFNEAASMLAKMTGSVDEALNVMDRLAGGNFLGGTVEQANAVARKARSMATAIRVTSAIAGISPQEAYSNMSNLQQSLAVGNGMTPYLAQSSGYSSLMQGMAYNATAAYTSWAAMHLDASQFQKAQALMAANGRAQRYSGSNGAALAAAVADNSRLFTEDERKRIEASYRAGRPNDVVDLVRRRIGENSYAAYLNNPAMQLAARARVAQGDEAGQEFLERLDNAGMEGGMRQAETHGNRILMRRAMHDMDASMARMTGGAGSRWLKERGDAVDAKLREIAIEKGGLTREGAEGMRGLDLRRYVEQLPGMDNVRLERIVNSETLSAAERQIDSATMADEDEEKAVGERLKQYLVASGKYGKDKREELEARIDKGGLGGVLTEILDSPGPFSNTDKAFIRRHIANNKITRSQAEEEKRKLDPLKESQRVDFNTAERLAAIEDKVKRENIRSSGELKGFLDSEGIMETKDEKSALELLTGKIKEMDKSGKLSVGYDDDNLSRTYTESARRMVSKIFGGHLGGVEGDAYKALVARMAGVVKDKDGKVLADDGMVDSNGKIRGKSIGDAFAGSLENLLKDEEFTKALGKGGVQQAREFIRKAREGKLEGLSIDSLASGVVSVIDENNVADRVKSSRQLSDLFKKEGYGKIAKDDSEAMTRIRDLSKAAGVFNGDDNKYAEMQEKAIDEFLASNGLGDLSAEERSQLAKNARLGLGKSGSIQNAMLAAINERAASAKGADRDRLEKAAKAIGGQESGEAWRAISGNVLRQIQPEGRRKEGVEGGYAAMSQASSMDVAGLMLASSMTGLSMGELVLNGYSGDLVAKADKSWADRQQNRIQRFIQSGGGSFAEGAIRDTRERLKSLSDKLKDSGITEKDVANAFGEDVGQKDREAALKKISGKLGKDKEGQAQMNLLRTLNEGSYEIGGEKGLGAVLGGKLNDEKLKKAKDSEILDITREANKKGSDAYVILDKIGDITRLVGQFMQSPATALKGAIPVSVEGGNIEVNNLYITQ